MKSMTLSASSSHSSSYSSPSPPSPSAKGKKTRNHFLLHLIFLVLSVHDIAVSASYDHLPHGQHHDHKAAHPYDFGYQIKDGHGSSNFHKESGDHANNKWGSYGLRDRDGRWRIVKYVADKHGFRVKIESNEPGVISHNPAHAIITGPDAYGHPYHGIHAPLHHHGQGYGHNHENGAHHVHHEYDRKHHEPAFHHRGEHDFHDYGHHQGYDEPDHYPQNGHGHGQGHKHEEHKFRHVRYEHDHKHHDPHHKDHEHYGPGHHDEHIPHIGFEGILHGPPQHGYHHPQPHQPPHHHPDPLLNFIPDVPLGPPPGTLDLKKAASSLVKAGSSSTTTPSPIATAAASTSEASVSSSTPFSSKRVASSANDDKGKAAKS